MARIASISHSLPQLPHARHAVGRVTAVGALVSLVSLIASVVVLGTQRLQRRLDAWADVRRQRAEDRQLWDLAATDPRLMAELVALQQHAERTR
ncbi:MAG TPA: hypothetical protein VFM98_20595 [Ramlibacter sp.]|uniref:hypothetical protein n=1 Tax=Ramlibacter sp. TaxID=1917967 RepID=UPI002D7E4CE2|nr:hypothetical protein [Ramlibacter sp.]HET8748009.1 hypothetical protein [Ramlibacter sp.]